MTGFLIGLAVGVPAGLAASFFVAIVLAAMDDE